MKVSAILSSTVLASAALASPLTSQRRARNAARLQARSAQRHSNFPFKEDTHEILHLNETTHEQYSSNWAGAVLIGSGYSAVTGTFTVPTPSLPSGSSSGEQYCASAWVGIDGDTCESAILQTGLDFCVDSNGPSFSAWYEWYPDYAYDFSGISFSAGNEVKVTVDASSKTGGTATVENLSTGKKVTHNFSGQSGNALCETNAEWILEDFSSGSSLVPFANFGTVTFTDISVTSGGSSSGASGATLIDIRQNGKVLTSSSASESKVTVKYVG
ncbi:A4/G1 family peptidase [Aspergillus alliaceus]|uniref:A4/G1 family peptidase n=1 Tax=Petromyces alliaceus TaxID=209559 RepID=UPI0012A6768D|nr:peptidase A4 family-domain-containing protein [Aspergillus alliaceus]KAB8228955.1 peptidase A4 family-domain-containing protein [Aspergillus alliaceus]